LKLLLLFVLIIHLINTPERLRMMAGTLVLFTAILGAKTIWQFMHGEAMYTSEGDVRALSTGIFGDPNDLALAMAMALPLALGSVFGKVSGWTRTWNLAAVPILVWCIFVTDSRGGMLALGACVFMFFSRRLGRVGLIVGTLAVVLLFAFGPARMSKMSSDEESAQGRVMAWEAGMRMLRGSPIWGVGKGQFVEHHRRTAHNSLVLCLGELGLAGTSLWLGLFYYAFRDTRRAVASQAAREMESEPGQPRPKQKRWSASTQSTIVRISLVTFIVGGFFLSRTYTPPLYVYLGMAVAAAKVEWVPSGQELPGASGRDWLNIAGMTLAGLILIQLLIRLWS
jgi:putative inorganic carbon (HCO3(-)) transporter